MPVDDLNTLGAFSGGFEPQRDVNNDVLKAVATFRANEVVFVYLTERGEAAFFPHPEQRSNMVVAFVPGISYVALHAFGPVTFDYAVAGLALVRVEYVLYTQNEHIATPEQESLRCRMLSFLAAGNVVDALKAYEDFVYRPPGA